MEDRAQKQESRVMFLPTPHTQEFVEETNEGNERKKKRNELSWKIKKKLEGREIKRKNEGKINKERRNVL